MAANFPINQYGSIPMVGMNSGISVPNDLTDEELGQILGLGTNDSAVDTMFQKPTPHLSGAAAALGGVGDMLAKIYALRTYKKQGEATKTLLSKLRGRAPQPLGLGPVPRSLDTVQGPASYGVFNADPTNLG